MTLLLTFFPLLFQKGVGVIYVVFIKVFCVDTSGPDSKGRGDKFK